MGRTHESNENVTQAYVPRWVGLDQFIDPSNIPQTKKHVTFNSIVYERQIFEGASESSESGSDTTSNETDTSCSGDSQPSRDNSSNSETNHNPKQENVDGDIISLIQTLTGQCHHTSPRPSSSNPSASPDRSRRRVTFSPVVCERIISPSLCRFRRRFDRLNRRPRLASRQKIQEIVQHLRSVPRTYTMMLDSSPVRKYRCTLQPVRSVTSGTASPKGGRNAERSKSRTRRGPTSKTRVHSRDHSTRRSNQSPENQGTRVPKRRKKRSEGTVSSGLLNARNLKNRSPTRLQHDTSRKTNDSSSVKDGGGRSTPPMRTSSSTSITEAENSSTTKPDSKESQEIVEISPARQRLLASVYKIRVPVKKRAGKATHNGDDQATNSESKDGFTQDSVLLNPYTHWKKIRSKCIKEVKRNESKCTLSALLQELTKQKCLNKSKGIEEEENNENDDKYYDKSEKSQMVDVAEKIAPSEKNISQVNESPLPRKRKPLVKKYRKEMSVADLIAALTEPRSLKKSKNNSSEVSVDMSNDMNDSSKRDSSESKIRRKMDLHAFQANTGEINMHRRSRQRHRSGSNRTKRKKSQASSKLSDEGFQSLLTRISLDNLKRNLKEKSSMERSSIANKREGSIHISTNGELRRRGSADNISRRSSHGGGSFHRRSSHDDICMTNAKPSQYNMSRNESKERALRRSRSLRREVQNANEGKKTEKTSRQGKRLRRSNSSVRDLRTSKKNTTRSKSQSVIEEEKGEDEETSPQNPPLPPPRPKRRPPKGYMTFEQVVGTAAIVPKKPTEQLSWETLVNARDENGISPVGLLRLKRQRRQRKAKPRPAHYSNDTSRKSSEVQIFFPSKNHSLERRLQKSLYHSSERKPWRSPTPLWI